MWISLNNYIISDNEEKIEKIICGNIENAVKKIDSNLEHIEYVTFLVASDGTIDSFFEKKELTYDEKLKYKTTLSSYQIENGLIKEIYIYSKLSDILITQSEAFVSPERFFESGYSFDGITKEEWADELRNDKLSVGYSSEKNRTTSFSREQILPYVRSASVGFSSRKSGIIGVSIKKKALLDGFESILTEGGGSILVLNKNDEFIMSEGAEFEISDDVLGLSSGQHKKIKSNGKSMYGYLCKSEKK